MKCPCGGTLEHLIDLDDDDPVISDAVCASCKFQWRNVDLDVDRFVTYATDMWHYYLSQGVFSDIVRARGALVMAQQLYHDSHAKP